MTIKLTREEAIQDLKAIKSFERYARGRLALDIAIEALKAQEYDEIVFDMNEFFSIVDDGKITVMRRGRGRVTVEHPAMGIMGMETTICSYGERSEE